MPKYVIVVRRKRSSFDFIIDKNFKPSLNIRGFLNRVKNNFGDRIQLVKETEVIYEGPVQSVANHPDAPDNGSWSLSTGTFDFVCFQEQRDFNCPVHGIGDGYDMLNHHIDKKSFDIENSNKRFLLHDDQSRGPKGRGKRDSGAYSEGCLIMPQMKFAEFNAKLRVNGFKSGDRIPLYIVNEV